MKGANDIAVSFDPGIFPVTKYPRKIPNSETVRIPHLAALLPKLLSGELRVPNLERKNNHAIKEK
jgi:hypothetical protein